MASCKRKNSIMEIPEEQSIMAVPKDQSIMAACKRTKPIMAVHEDQSIMAADWSNLPEDLVISIAKRVGCLEDFIKFRSLVYKPWSLVVTKEHFIAQELPWLMLFHHFLKDTRYFFHNVITYKNYELHPTTASAHNNVVCFSSLGWLITVDIHDDVKLFHPLRRASKVIELGRVKSTCGYYDNTRKFVLSSSPCSTSDYMVMSIAFNQISLFCENKWIFYQGSLFTDIAYYRGLFYGVEHFDGGIYVFEPNCLNKKLVTSSIPKSMDIFKSGGHRYLVESGGSLLVVLQFWGSKQEPTRFRVYKVPFGNRKWKESEVKDLGTRSLFLSRKNSFSLEATDYYTCRANCIYFAESHFSFKRAGIFNMKDGKVEEFTREQVWSDFWFQPSFY